MKRISIKVMLMLISIFILLINAVSISYSENESKENPSSDKSIDNPDKEIIEMKDDTGEDADDDLFDEKKPKFKLKGHVKNLYTFQRTDNYIGNNPFTAVSKNLSADLTRIRLTPEFSYSDIIFIHIDYDNELILSSYNKSIDFNNYWRPSGYNDLCRMSWEPYHGKELYYRTKIHRAYIKISVKYFSATIGRQQIRFGSGRLWNPLDILNPISPTLIEGAEEQKGSDAVRLDYYPNETTEISAVFNPKRHSNKLEDFGFEESNYIARAKTSISDFDFAILGGYISKRGVTGFDVSAIILKGMLRGSVICSKPEDDDLYIQASAGYEYTFKNGLYFLVEYFFNQNGLNYNSDLKVAFYESQLYGFKQIEVEELEFRYDNYSALSNQFITINQHYLSLALGYDFHPLLRGEMFMIYDFQGSGIFITPSLKYNILENLDFMAGMTFGHLFNNKASDFKMFDKKYLYFASLSYYF